MPAASVGPVSAFHCSLHSSRHCNSVAVALSASSATVGLNLHLYYHCSAVGRPVFFSSFSMYYNNYAISGRLLIEFQWKLWYRLFFLILHSLLSLLYYLIQLQILSTTYFHLISYLPYYSFTINYCNLKLIIDCSNSYPTQYFQLNPVFSL